MLMRRTQDRPERQAQWRTLLLAGALLGSFGVAFAQATPSAKPTASAAKTANSARPSAASPASSPAAPAGRTVTLTFARPGSYDYWTVGKAGAGPVQTALIGAKSAAIIVPPDTTAIDVLSSDSGLVATLDTTRLEAPAETISPNDFTRLRTVKVAVTAGGKPVEKAQVTLTDATGKSTAKALTADDAGMATFNDVPLGKATVSAVSGASGTKTSSEVTLAPAKGGGPVTLPVALAGDVPTLAAAAIPSAAPGLPVAPAPEHPSEAVVPPGSAGNSWVVGIFGLMLLGIGLYYGLRTAKKRGITVESALKRIGVETPATAPTNSAAAKPRPAPLPPLPALSDLPSAGPAPVAANFAVSGGNISGPARLQGIAGPVAGETFDLDMTEPLTVGRDISNSLALSQDTAISRRHARIGKSGMDWEIADEGSSNGTFVNGVKLASGQPRPLRAGDEIQIGGARFRFEGA